MLLNSLEIQNLNIVKAANSGNFTESSYNLRIGKIITHDGTITESISIMPQGLITVISEEELHIPPNTLAIATVKNGLSQKGVLALNIGLIDSGWRGPINSTIINFGKGSFKLSKGDIFLRVTFYNYNALPPHMISPITPLKSDAYINNTTTNIRAYLGEKFLSLDQTAKEIEKNVENSLWESVRRLGTLFGLVSVVSLGIGILSFMITNVSDNRELNDKVIKLESEKNTFIDKMSLLEQKLDQAQKESDRKYDELLKQIPKK